jgi:hypothetical protein
MGWKRLGSGMGFSSKAGKARKPPSKVNAIFSWISLVPRSFTISSSLKGLSSRRIRLRMIRPSATNSSNPNPIRSEPMGTSEINRVVQPS